ncbi:DUF3566 domain-containing protein [Georgenia sp. 311]|uniref:DUF3566 domain-containing protein n=1 Tax=Georgenia sp. 311 TaxID=2585134 RepID=UPI0011119E4C|nr:DUF3566 domain-containing protein [Georgenia sp. 311]TNC18192.1 DUF3566 domain-containing protein [Georgenia sp. 311]
MSTSTPGPEDVTRPAATEPGTGSTTSQDRTAIRTSLAERFAAAKGVSEHPVVPHPDQTAPVGGASAVRTGQVSGGSATAPRYGAQSSTTERPAAAAGATQTAQGPAAGKSEPRAAARPSSGPRRVRLSVARVDPWSVMKLSFLLSIAVGIGIVVAAAAMWLVLDSMHVFADIEELLVTLDSENFLRLMDYVQFDRVVSMAAIIAVVDILLLTALATLGAFLYNIVAALVGGVHLTLTDD